MRFHELLEGASMMPYFKDPKDKSQKTWTFPDAWQNDDALDTPYMSNYSMRMFLRIPLSQWVLPRSFHHQISLDQKMSIKINLALFYLPYHLHLNCDNRICIISL